MRIRKLDFVLDAKAEGFCAGLAYNTEIVSCEGISIHFWCGASFDDARLQEALKEARNARDVVCASASCWEPSGFWANQVIPRVRGELDP